MKCKICGKPLTNPISTLLEIGPVCRMRMKLKEHKEKQGNMFGNRAKYRYKIIDNVLCIMDEGRDCRSVTNDMENVLAEIASDIGCQTFSSLDAYIYRDSMGVYDGVKFDFRAKDVRVNVRHLREVGGTFIAPNVANLTFYYIGEKDVLKAIEKVKGND